MYVPKGQKTLKQTSIFSRSPNIPASAFKKKKSMDTGIGNITFGINSRKDLSDGRQL